MTSLESRAYQRGFSLLELLVAMVVCVLLSGAVAGMMAPARAAFDRTPAALDLHQRGRAGLDLLTTVVRSAGANVGAADGLAAFPDLMPAVIPLPSPENNSADGEFGALFAVSVVVGGSQGRLDRDQPGAGGGAHAGGVSRLPAGQRRVRLQAWRGGGDCRWPRPVRRLRRGLD